MGLAASFPKELFGFVGHYESYAYTVVQEHGSWSLRRYASAVAAEVETSAGDDSSFMILAKYIGVFSTPENTVRSPVAMTTPVVSTPIAMTTPVVSTPIAMTTPVVSTSVAMTTPVVSAGSSMRFVLPSQYRTVEEAPAPTNNRVRLVATPEMDAAAITFSGRCNSMEEATVQYEELLGHIKSNGLEVAGPWSLHRFNPPYTLAPFRRNEVVVPVSTAAAPPQSMGA
eukprot:CAMPEP_0197944192 /NCGR_PEP_ID=MMETSP1439-20131203/125290_1 /TAXON_ID=66791 /ORGANISM="Gonyaulax spinifera, Strain CCMP409" /LENGTH=226 /DNA_ID=CAMNT_0043567449 /DNA_START=58 /DNA_END=738 /DNA_ORIENTATION=+